MGVVWMRISHLLPLVISLKSKGHRINPIYLQKTKESIISKLYNVTHPDTSTLHILANQKVMFGNGWQEFPKYSCLGVTFCGVLIQWGNDGSTRRPHAKCSLLSGKWHSSPNQHYTLQLPSLPPTLRIELVVCTTMCVGSDSANLPF